MGNSVPRAGIEPTYLAFQASVLAFDHIGTLMSSLYPHPPVYAAPFLRDQGRLIATHHPGIVSIVMLTIPYIEAMASHIHTYTA